MDAFPATEDPAESEPKATTGSPPEIVSQSDFVDCVDRCVASLLVKPAAATAQASEQTQLRAWLAGKSQALDDGTPIDFALFDATILSVEERLPAAGSLDRSRLLSAARRLAEDVYAGVPTPAAVET